MLSILNEDQVRILVELMAIDFNLVVIALGILILPGLFFMLLDLLIDLYLWIHR